MRCVLIVEWLPPPPSGDPAERAQQINEMPKLFAKRLYPCGVWLWAVASGVWPYADVRVCVVPCARNAKPKTGLGGLVCPLSPVIHSVGA